MSRASAIWLVVDDVWVPLAAFTVRHECRSWLVDADADERNKWTVVKLRDNPPRQRFVGGALVVAGLGDGLLDQSTVAEFLG